MNRQPDGMSVRRSPFDPVPGMGGNQQVIAGHQMEGLMVFFVQNNRLSLKQHDPFVPILIVPLPGRRNMALGYNALNPNIIPIQEAFNQFFRQWVWYVFKKVVVSRIHAIVVLIL